MRLASAEEETEGNILHLRHHKKKGVLGIVVVLSLCALFSSVIFMLWLTADHPRYECFTVTHLDYTYPETIYTSRGEEIGGNGHIGMFHEGQSWCGMLGSSKAGWRDWIEDNQSSATTHTSG